MLRNVGEPVKEHHFSCTFCGRCCCGWLPLTLDEAIAEAGRFPLAMVLSLVRQGDRSFDLISRLGAILQLPDKCKVAVLISPTVYIPPSMHCPALTADNRCSIHSNKPLRCRAMPFYPCRGEEHQADMLMPRKGWLCDTSEVAPVVYRDGVILDRTDFDAELKALLDDAPFLRSYADKLLKQNPALMGRVAKAARNPASGRVVISFSSFFRYDRRWDIKEFALKQVSVIGEWLDKVKNDSDLEDYSTYYKATLDELAWFAERAAIDRKEDAIS